MNMMSDSKVFPYDLDVKSDLARFLERIDDYNLISAEGGSFSITPSERRQIAIFRNHLILVTRGTRHTVETRQIIERARRMNVPVDVIVETTLENITKIYEYAAGHGDQGDSVLDLERQNDLRRIIAQAASMRASDVHMRLLPKYLELKVRVYGRMKSIGSRDAAEGAALMKAAFAVASGQGASGTDTTFQAGALTAKSGILPAGVEMLRLQYSPMTEGRGALVIRLKYRGKVGETDIDSLGYEPIQAKDIAIMRRRTNGMYLFAGKVSSGKSTTLERVLNSMYEEKGGEISIYTVEDPKELALPGAIQVEVTATSDADRSAAFAKAIKSGLRSDPNVLVVGELRDKETAGLAIEAAMTGHALWSTVHAGSALGILSRLTDLEVESWKLEDPTIVRGLIYQRLIGTLCPHCKITIDEGLRRGKIDEELHERMLRLTRQPVEELFVRGPGCERCDGGLNGRTVVAETVMTDQKLLEHYVRGERIEMKNYWVRPKEEGGLGGMPTMHHAMIKVGAGIADVNEIEEEVDLLESYERQYKSLSERLYQDVNNFKARRKK